MADLHKPILSESETSFLISHSYPIFSLIRFIYLFAFFLAVSLNSMALTKNENIPVNTEMKNPYTVKTLNGLICTRIFPIPV